MKKYNAVKVVHVKHLHDAADVGSPGEGNHGDGSLLPEDAGRLVYGSVHRVARLGENGEWAHGVMSS